MNSALHAIFAAFTLFASLHSHATEPQCASNYRDMPPVPMTAETIKEGLNGAILPSTMVGTYEGVNISDGVGGRGHWIDLAMSLKIAPSGMTEFKMCTGDAKPDNREAYWDFTQQASEIDANGIVTLTVSGKAAKVRGLHWMNIRAMPVTLTLRWNPSQPQKISVTAAQKTTTGLFRSHIEHYPYPNFEISRAE